MFLKGFFLFIEFGIKFLKFFVMFSVISELWDIYYYVKLWEFKN